MKRFTILITDDDEQVLDFLRPKLRNAGYNVLTAGNGIETLEKVKTEEPDLLVLDLIMPKMDGFEALKELRNFSAIPVIVLSGRGADIDKIKGLELGADDYLAKPFNPDELISRIQAVRRRLEPAGTRKRLMPLSFEDLTVDFDKHFIKVSGEEIRLTNVEWLLLSELARNAGRLVTYNHLLTTVWGAEYRDDIQLLRAWMSRLRRKIEKDPDKATLIRTFPKAGYVMDLPSS